MKTLLEVFIRNDDSAGGTFHLMKKMSELEKLAALTGKILSGKEAYSQEITNQTRRKCDMENFKEEVTQETDDLATYEGRAWEELSDDELVRINTECYDRSKSIVERMNMLPLKEKVEKILEKRIADMTKCPDDGSVKGLIVNGDYSHIGEGTMIQNIVNGVTAWIVKGGDMCDEVRRVTKVIDTYRDFDEIEGVADNVRTFCRRKFKKEDIILCSVNSFYSIESGIVFLEDKICTFDDKKLEYIISYAEMEDIDFDEDTVTINVSSGEEVTLHCDDEEYSKGVFNLLMDIKDRLEQA